MRLSASLVVLVCAVVALCVCVAARADPGESEPLEPGVQEYVAEMRTDTQGAIEDLERVQSMTPRVDAVMRAINEMWSSFFKLHRSVANSEQLLETAEVLSQQMAEAEEALPKLERWDGADTDSSPKETPAPDTPDRYDDGIRSRADPALVKAIKEMIPDVQRAMEAQLSSAENPPYAYDGYETPFTGQDAEALGSMGSLIRETNAAMKKQSVSLLGSMGSIHNIGLELEGIRRRASDLGPLAFNCEAGTAPYNGDGACAGCDLGHFAPANSGSCSPCPRGTYADATHSATCTECAPGKVAHDPGTIVCEDCPAGRVSAGAGASLCVECPPHSLPSHDRTTCESCPPGTEHRGAVCVACPAGTFRAADSMPVCLGCPPNTYSSAVRATECQPCGENEFTFDALGNTDVSECRSCAESWHAFDRGEGPSIPMHALSVCATALCTLRAGAVGRQLCRMYGNATELEELEAARARGALATASWATVFIVPLLISCLFVVFLWIRNLPRIKNATSTMLESVAAVMARAGAGWNSLRASTESLAKARDTMGTEADSTGVASAAGTDADAIALDTLAHDSAATNAVADGAGDAPSPVPEVHDRGAGVDAPSGAEDLE